MPLPYPTEGGTSSCRAAGERGPVIKRDEGPGETEGVSPGEISRRVEI